MALFNRKHTPQHKTRKGSHETISSILSQEMQISGEIRFKGKARIDGLIDGNVKGEYLILSETGKIIGDVEVDCLICHGSIKGNINAEQVTAHSTSTLHGMLVATTLTVESGASLNGEIKATRQQAEEAAKKPSLTVKAKKIKEAA